MLVGKHLDSDDLRGFLFKGPVFIKFSFLDNALGKHYMQMSTLTEQSIIQAQPCFVYFYIAVTREGVQVLFPSD